MPDTFRSLADAADWYGAWLRDAALPLWSATGLDAARGSFQEAIAVDGRPLLVARRSRVQSRQIWVFATAAQAGMGSHYAQIATGGYSFYREHYRRPDGLYARLADAHGAVLDPTPVLYEQAFSLLAMAGLQAATGAGLEADAHELREALQALRHPAGGYREAGDQPFQANAHMHLLEAALAWEELGDASWCGLSDEIAQLALERFIDPGSSLLREFFDAAWRPLAERAGGLVEPGHQFEWAWLIDWWARRRGGRDLGDVVRGLYANGARGVDPGRDVAVASVWEDFRVRDGGARIWAQAERLKAAVLFGHEADALSAARGLRQFLEGGEPGAWRDRMQADGDLAAEAAPATSLYHLLGAILPLLRATGRLPQSV